MKEREFILEYSCNQKHWHYNNGSCVENSNTYFTVIKPCTNKKAKLFIEYLENLNIKKNEYTKDLLLECADNFDQLNTNFNNMNKIEFIQAAMIAAMQSLISNNPGISCKYAAKKAQEYALCLADELLDEEVSFPDKVV